MPEDNQPKTIFIQELIDQGYATYQYDDQFDTDVLKISLPNNQNPFEGYSELVIKHHIVSAKYLLLSNV